jgi:hypothetical protein
VTEVRLRAALHRIAALACVEADMPPKLIEEAVVGSGGDLRHAIHLLQFAAIGYDHHDTNPNVERNLTPWAIQNSNDRRPSGKGKKKTRNKTKVPRKFPKTKSAPAVGSSNAVQSRHLLGIGRDPMLSMTHAVGRVLRAKRVAVASDAGGDVCTGPSTSLCDTLTTPHATVVPTYRDFGYNDVLPLPQLTSSSLTPQMPRPFSYHAATSTFASSGRRRASVLSTQGRSGPERSFGETHALSFVPEQVVAECPLPPAAFAAFVQHNAMEFFSDISDIAQAFDMLSVADVLHGMGEKLHCFGAFPACSSLVNCLFIACSSMVLVPRWFLACSLLVPFSSPVPCLLLACYFVLLSSRHAG